jgi:hypothetical protein
MPDSWKLRASDIALEAVDRAIAPILLEVGEPTTMKVSRLPTLLTLLASSNIHFLRTSSVAAHGLGNAHHRRMASQQSLSASDLNGTYSHSFHPRISLTLPRSSPPETTRTTRFLTRHRFLQRQLLQTESARSRGTYARRDRVPGISRVFEREGE